MPEPKRAPEPRKGAKRTMQPSVQEQDLLAVLDEAPLEWMSVSRIHSAITELGPEDAPRRGEIYRVLENLSDDGLVEARGNRWRLTRRGAKTISNHT